MPFGDPDRLPVLAPCLEDGARFRVKGLDGAAVAAGDDEAAIRADVAAVCAVVDAEAADGLEEFAGLDGEDLDAAAAGDGEGFGGWCCCCCCGLSLSFWVICVGGDGVGGGGGFRRPP